MSPAEAMEAISAERGDTQGQYGNREFHMSVEVDPWFLLESGNSRYLERFGLACVDASAGRGNVCFKVRMRASA
ncbi:hypothetical protein SARC_06643 [Sphaeroforma arctica JP610]|uniref:Uncharacterized protein n=1 Tax=Sphaeroforma arctica JP610 TaxID=667725 RepID=A0A0L0FW00_9EUKA|nr:hypothetical protein SARC_06643 [Sphaeroforma arctica JP610]KNC81012.1 hypothetical protein SARC_06643 [Sphaeroforma arctica JP610]|eukprot:XP_014154914.1 hypothetical protein SARC_06643 [Sphaeroforma arctica JP610]